MPGSGESWLGKSDGLKPGAVGTCASPSLAVAFTVAAPLGGLSAQYIAAPMTVARQAVAPCGSGLNRHSSHRVGPHRHGHRPEWHRPVAVRAG